MCRPTVKTALQLLSVSYSPPTQSPSSELSRDAGVRWADRNASGCRLAMLLLKAGRPGFSSINTHSARRRPRHSTRRRLPSMNATVHCHAVFPLSVQLSFRLQTLSSGHVGLTGYIYNCALRRVISSVTSSLNATA